MKGIPPTDLNMSHSTENATCPYTFDRRKSPSGRVLSDTLTEKAWKEATQHRFREKLLSDIYSDYIGFPGKLHLQRTEDVESI